MAALMIQGCGSDVGKTILVAGLCRLFADRGLRVRPFKPQNMSNNAAVTADGGEIGRAQALQARACRVEPTSRMNPILLKPEADSRSQLIVRGRRAGIVAPGHFVASRRELLEVVLECFHELQAECDLVLVEGAGSPAETNLREHDIANMGFARAADVPVVLAGDISRGHVIASLIGAHAVLDEADRRQIHGFIVNKFRGEVGLFAPGIATIEQATGWPSFGVVPWLLSAATLPAEDAASLRTESPHDENATHRPHIGILRLPHMANFDDFDPLMAEPGLRVEYIDPGTALPGSLSVVILPGTKSTLADLAFVRRQGWDIDLAAHVRRGGRVLGICGGYQMLGRALHDPEGLEGTPGSAQGLGHLDVITTLLPDKQLRLVRGRSLKGGHPLNGYEIHLGLTRGPDVGVPLLLKEDGTPDGAVTAHGRVAGCYLHGLFANDEWRRAWLADLGACGTRQSYDTAVQASLDELARVLAKTLDVDRLASLAETGGRGGSFFTASRNSSAPHRPCTHRCSGT